MLAYKFDKNTKEYKGVQNAQINPLEGGYLLPANCTFIEPMEGEENKTPCFINDNWELITDWRGEYMVKLDDLTFSKVDFLGDVPLGYQFVSVTDYKKYMSDNDAFRVIDGVFKDVSDTEEYKDLKFQKAKQAKINEAAIKAKDFIENKACFQFDEKNNIEATDGNIGKLTAYALGFQTGQFEIVQWTSKEDNVLTLNEVELMRVLLGLGTIQSNVWNIQYVRFKNQIEGTQTIEDVNKIEIIYEV